VSAHHLAECGEIGWTAGAGGEQLADLAEVGRAEYARRRDREERRVDVAVVLKSVDLASLHAHGLARPHLD
jgi:hypothetical protein